ncbi:MAG: nuclear transport factor 2 family protein [Candidatus Hydrogenedentota bacterium]
MACNPGEFIEQWKAAVAAHDHGAIAALVSDSVVFHSPAVYTPVTEKPYVLHLFGFVDEAIQGFTYIDEYTKSDGAALVFRGSIDGLTIEGVDFFTLDEENKIVEMKVMLRPLNAAAALAQFVKGRFESLAAGKA